MAKRKEITASFYIGDKKVDKLPEDYLEKMSENLSTSMSLYYTAHPDEYRRLCESDIKPPENTLDKMMERLGETMSSYYTSHPDEYKRMREADAGGAPC